MLDILLNIKSFHHPFYQQKGIKFLINLSILPNL